MIAGAHATWNLIDDIRQLFQFPFMVNAYRAGTAVAITSAVVGWYMVLRRQAFAGHTVALAAFPGAAGAALLGVSPTAGYFAFSGSAALAIAALPASTAREGSDLSAGVGVVQTSALALGFLFVSLSSSFLNGVTSLLFGTFLGITSGQVVTLAVVAGGCLGVVAVIARPLLFASVDPDVAAARGVPARALGVVFLVVLGITAGAASQITGTLLVFALLVLPAATAQRLVLRPARSLAATVAIGLGVTWLGLAIAYFSPWPVGFVLTTLAFAAYVAASGVSAVRRGRAAR